MEKLYYTITEVSELLDLKPYVIRYWETEFPQIKGSRRQGRNRRYTPNEVEFIKQLKELLHEKKFTIKGAKQKLKEKKQVAQTVVTTKPAVDKLGKLKAIKEKIHYISTLVESATSKS